MTSSADGTLHESESSRTSAGRRRRRTIVGLGINWAYQFVLVGFGLAALSSDDNSYLLVWCLLATIYAVAAVIMLGLLSSRPARPTTPPPKRTIRWLSVVVAVFTAVPAFIGVLSAIQVIWVRLDPSAATDLGMSAEGIRLLGVWAMLLGWGFLHWGFAQVYALQDARAYPARALEFPGQNPSPSLVDYVYVAFTVGTTFAASDVSFMNTRTRWLVTIHSVASFGLNALTIALAFNTIMGL